MGNHWMWAIAAALLFPMYTFSQVLPDPEPIPPVPAPKPIGSVPLGDPNKFPEVKLTFPIAEGPYGPTWQSIEQNYPAKEMAWLRDAKFGIWIHFGPQAAGQSGDWYARRMYIEGSPAYKNHLRDFGHPSEVGYKDLLKDWNPTELDPAALIQLYQQAGAKYVLIQGVHHDQFDNWNSKYQPWNSVNLGPKRDLLKEWTVAARKAGIRYGVSFHHEYTWWWWQTAFRSDKTGPKAGIPYDGNLTLADGKGKWWEGLDPRLLYGIDLREYKGWDQDGYAPASGILVNHLDYCHWYATRWALRIMDVINHYDPDFIYTDGVLPYPFYGQGAESGYKCDAAARVVADYYNHTLQTRGKVDTFSIIKFHPPSPGVVNTFEANWPDGIKTDQPWIAETANGDWYYAPNFTYSSKGLIRYMLECVSRDGAFCVNIPLKPNGAIEPACVTMLKEVGAWMKINGDAIYGSHAWTQFKDGTHSTPRGMIGRAQADAELTTSDFRYTVGKDGAIYAICMAVPDGGASLTLPALATGSRNLNSAITRVTLLGSPDPIDWKQQADGLHLNCPAQMPFNTAVVFKIACEQPALTAEAQVNQRRDSARQFSVVGVKNTQAGGASTLSAAGDYGGGNRDEEPPTAACDGDPATKYYNQAPGQDGKRGLGSGLLITHNAGPVVMDGITFTTANDRPARDPVQITIEGSNDPDAMTAGNHSFTLLYRGTSGLDADPGRSIAGKVVSFQNDQPYRTYRV
ncbi:MAG: alpha-L-fucosidase, partial [Tepidisphaeraceae bacterium]